MNTVQLREELFREMNPLLDSEVALEKMLKFVRTIVPATKTKSEEGWANRFAGAWKDSRSADEIVKNIRESRTPNSRDIML